ncbi:MAG TPA: NAD(P)/FAD-dependent oxidoreductase [Solirubrobacteraceae bacterium]|nr:NAD(P)/FAD-dependent oxidoreductase [Solirubrobacteraceae bacterium]
MRHGDVVALYPVSGPAGVAEARRECAALVDALGIDVAVGMGGWHAGLPEGVVSRAAVPEGCRGGRTVAAMRTFDVVVIGGGPAGEEVSARVAGHGLSVALVEDRLVGGECAYWACLPSKGLLRPYEALAEARRVPGAAEAVSGGLDVPAVLRRRDEIINDFDDAGPRGWVESRGVAFIRGHGRLAGERRVVVGDQELEARRAVVLAGGSVASFPPIEGLDQVKGAWTNREATTAREIPQRLLIVGGGAVGVEMAQAFQTLGSQVTLVEGERRLLPREEEFACAQVTTALERYGVDIRTGQKAISFSQNGSTVTVTTAREQGGVGESAERLAHGGTATVTATEAATAVGDVLLVALGRKAPTSDLGVETVGLAPGETVEVDDHMRVPGTPWLYAVGDINGRALFTHMGKYQARLAADCIVGNGAAIAHGADGRLSPRVIFTDPQVAAVGHTTDTAAAAGLEVDVYDTETSGNLGGEFYGHNAPGTTRFLVDRERRVLVGCTITGSEVVDFLHAATIAVVGEVPLERLRHAVPPFPTRSELWLSLLEQAGV